MSTNRVSKNAGFVHPSQLPRGPNGRALCRQCFTEVPPGRRTFCSQGCVDEWMIRSNPQHVRKLVFKRDQGICALCNSDTMAGVSEKRRHYGYRGGDRWQADHIVPVIEGGGECGLENYRTLCTACHRRVTAELARRLADKRHQELLDTVARPEFGNTAQIQAVRKLAGRAGKKAGRYQDLLTGL